jgi:transaldolase/glucose-6-phosphate isomerase
VDKVIEGRLRQTDDADKHHALSGLRGKVAIANAKLAYQHYKHLFPALDGKLRAKGARVQRLRTSLEENIDQAKQVMATLDRSGISIDVVTAKLVEEGVQLFADAFDNVLGAVARKRAVNLGEKLNSQTYNVSPGLKTSIGASLEAWRHDGNVRRLWAGDAGLWTGSDEATWLSWLGIVEEQRQQIGSLSSLAEDIRAQGFSHILLLGMGGSSLGPEVFAKSFGRQNGRPELLVLDSTDPAQIRTIESKIDPAQTLFIVSSKSGSTLEPNILKQYF